VEGENDRIRRYGFFKLDAISADGTPATLQAKLAKL
jgi:hypothetical protein